MSWGGLLGAIIPAVEERPKTAIILAGGLNGLGRPEANQINYVTRVKMPTLMLVGKYDTVFPYGRKPMFDFLGTPDEAQGTEVVRNGPYSAQQRIYQGNPSLARSLFGASELTRTSKDPVKHRFRELAGEGILLAWMVGGDQYLA